MAMQKIKIDELTDAIVDALEEYREDVTEGVKDSVKTVAKEAAVELRRTSPKKTGGYAKGWTQKKVFENAQDLRMSVCNPKHYRRIHLLENGHAKVNGGRVEGIAHVYPTEQNAIRKLEGKVKVVIQK